MGDEGEPACPGIRIRGLGFDENNALIIWLTEELGCPVCGREGDRWVIPTGQDKAFHRDDLRLDPGE